MCHTPPGVIQSQDLAVVLHLCGGVIEDFLSTLMKNSYAKPRNQIVPQEIRNNENYLRSTLSMRKLKTSC